MNIEDVLDKIKKCLALAQSANEHEAAAAAARAADLMARYQIEEAQLQGSTEPDAPVLGDNVIETNRSRVAWRCIVASGLSTALGAHFYTTGGRLMVIGRESDARAVRYMHGLICNEIDRLSDEAWTEQRHLTVETVRTWKNGFRMGAALTVKKRLVATKAERDVALQADESKSTALLVLNRRQDAIDKFTREYRLRNVPYSPIRSRSGYAAGREAGSSINIGSRASGALSGGNGRLGC